MYGPLDAGLARAPAGVCLPPPRPRVPVCPECGRYLDRVRRSVFERAIFAVSYRCRCGGYRLRAMHPHLRVRIAFLLSRHTHCVRCASPDVHVHAAPPAHDVLSRRAVRRLQRLLGARVYRCADCRAHYADWRSPRRESDSARL